MIIKLAMFKKVFKYLECSLRVLAILTAIMISLLYKHIRKIYENALLYNLKLVTTRLNLSIGSMRCVMYFTSITYMTSDFSDWYN